MTIQTAYLLARSLPIGRAQYVTRPHSAVVCLLAARVWLRINHPTITDMEWCLMVAFNHPERAKIFAGQ